MAEIDRNKETDLATALRLGEVTPYKALHDANTLAANVYREAILQSGENAFSYIDEGLTTPDDDVDLSPLQQVVADAMNTRLEWEQSVADDGMNIKDIPPEYRSDFYDDAVANNPDASEFAPSAPSTDPVASGDADKHLYEALREGAISAQDAVQSMNKIVEGVYTEAILQAGNDALIYVDHAMTDHDDGSQIQRAVFEARETRIAIWEQGIANDGMNLEHVPVEYRNPDFCLDAVENNPEAIQYVPADTLGGGVIADIIKQNPEVIEFISAEHMAKLTNLDWKVEASINYEGAKDINLVTEGEVNGNPQLGSMERGATVEMTAPNGLKLEFDIQTDSSSSDGYGHVGSLREFYESGKLAIPEVGGSFSVNGVKAEIDHDQARLITALESKWEDAARIAMPAVVPQELQPYADISLSDLEAFKQQVEQIDAAQPDFTPVDNSLAVARNEAGEVEVSFKLQDKEGNEFEYTMDTYSAKSLQGAGGELADAAAYDFVSDQGFEINKMIDRFNGQELKIEGIAVDHEDGNYYTKFMLDGQFASANLDSEDLSIDLSELKLSDAQAEHLAVMVAKEINERGITPPMGIERAEELTQELGEALRKDAYLTDNGTSYQLYVESGDSDTMISKASYSSLTQACEGIGEMVNEARMEQSLAIQREEVEDRKHEVKQEHKQSSISM